MLMEIQIVIVLCFTILSSSRAMFGWAREQERDRIMLLPGQPPVTFQHYSGYVTVNETHGRALFYWLTEAATHAQTKPLLLWLNGGPGCSSVAYGASEEIGPFKIHENGSSLYLNKHSWNKEANLLFLESPAGVGFSYTNTSSDLMDMGDERTAQDALVFLLNWMQRFPQYQQRDFYIAGESYAGHYIPQLARQIYNLNNESSHPIINLKGLMIGNGVLDDHYDSIGTITHLWTHAIISDHTYKRIMKSCTFRTENASEECHSAINYAYDHEVGAIDQYSIYTENCNASRPTLRPRNTLLRPQFYGYNPCSENYAEIYYNRADVQKALHANTTGIPYNWTACSDTLYNYWKDIEFSMLPTFKMLIDAGIRIWIYSGDTDAVVPVTATRFSLSHLNLKIKTPWYPWYTGGEVGGWTEVYDGLTFATVRGAGHEVPSFQPSRAFKLFKTFLSGTDLPTY